MNKRPLPLRCPPAVSCSHSSTPTRRHTETPTRSRWTLLAAALLAGTPLAQARTDLFFTRNFELPDVGLKVRLMSSARQEQVPPPTAATYEVLQGTNQWKTDLFDPLDLWRQSQRVGEWSDEHGNHVIIAALQSPVPEAFARPHISTQEFLAWQTKHGGKANGAVASADVPAWVARFLDAPGAEPLAIRERYSNLQGLTEYHLASRPTSDLAYVFTLQRSPSGRRAGAPTRFLVAFLLKPDVDVLAAREALFRSFFPSVAEAELAPPAAPPARDAGEKSKTEGVSSELLTSRAQAAAGIRNMPGWWSLELEHYIILSDLKTHRHGLIESLQSDLEALRNLYAAHVPARVPVNEVSVVRVFGDPEEYLRYVGPDYGWSSGLWVPSRRELLIRPGDVGTSREQRLSILRTVYHEAFHQYLYYALDRVDVSAWFNEGYACVFQNAVFHDGKPTIEEDPERLATLKRLIDSGTVDLWPLLTKSYTDFYSRDAKAMEENYALAWALVYYLRRGAPLEKMPRYAGILPNYVDALWKTHDPAKATTAAFEGLDPTEFTRDFIEFWKSPGRRSLARRAPVLPKAPPSRRIY